MLNPEINPYLFPESPLRTQIYQPERDLNKDYNSGAGIRNASSHGLPSNIKGLYTTSNHRITLPHDHLPNSEGVFTEAHESGHALGLRDEFKTDCYAAARTGHYEFIRSPVTRAPVVSLN